MVAGKEIWEGLLSEDCLVEVLSTKPTEIMLEACQVLEKYGWSVKKLKSE